MLGRRVNLGRISKAIQGSVVEDGGQRKSPLQEELRMLSKVLVAVAMIFVHPGWFGWRSFGAIHYWR